MDSSVGNNDANNPIKTIREGVDDDLKYMIIQLCEEVNFLRMIKKESEERMRHLVTDQHKHERQLEEEILKNSLLKEKHEQKLIDLDRSYQDEIRQLTREKSKLIWENESWEKDLKSVKDEVRSLQLEKYNLERMIREQSHLLKTQTAAGEGYMKQATIFEERFTSMKHSVESCNAQVMNLSKEVNEAKILNERLTFINAHHACLKRDLESKLEDKEKLISELEVKVKLQDTTFDTKPSEKEERSGLLGLENVKQLTANETVLKKQLENAQQRIGELSKQLEEAQLLLDQYLTIHQKYKDNISSMEDEKKDMQDKITKVEEERNEDELRGKRIENEMDRLKVEWNEKEKSFGVKLSNLNSKVKSLNEAKKDLETQNKSLETTRKELLIKVKNQQEQIHVSKIDVGTMVDIYSVTKPRSTNSYVQTCDVTGTSIISPHQSTTSNANVKIQQSGVSLEDVDDNAISQTDCNNSHPDQLNWLDSSTTHGSPVVTTSESSKLDHSKKALVDHRPTIHLASKGTDEKQNSDTRFQEGANETDNNEMSRFKHPEIMESKCKDSSREVISTKSLLCDTSYKEEVTKDHVGTSHLHDDGESIAMNGGNRATDLQELRDEVDRQVKNSAPETENRNFVHSSGDCERKSACDKSKDGDDEPHQVALQPAIFHKNDETVCVGEKEAVTVSETKDSKPHAEDNTVFGNVNAIVLENEMGLTLAKKETVDTLKIATPASSRKEPCYQLHHDNETSMDTRTEVEDHTDGKGLNQPKSSSQTKLANRDDEHGVQNEIPIEILKAAEKQKDTALPARVVDVEEFIDISKSSKNLPAISEIDYTVSDIGGRIVETSPLILNTLQGVDSTMNGVGDNTGAPILDGSLNAPDGVDEIAKQHRATNTINLNKESVNEKDVTHLCNEEVAPSSILPSANETYTFGIEVLTKRSQDETIQRKQLTSENISQSLKPDTSSDEMLSWPVDQSVNPSVSLSNVIQRKEYVAQWPIVGHDVCTYPRYSSQETKASKPQVTVSAITPPSVLTSAGVWLAADQQSCPLDTDVKRMTGIADRLTNTIPNLKEQTGKLRSPVRLTDFTTATDPQTYQTTSHVPSLVVSSIAILPDSVKDPNRKMGSDVKGSDQIPIPLKDPTIETNPDLISSSVKTPLPRTSLAEVEPSKVDLKRDIKIILKDSNSASDVVPEKNPQHEKSAPAILASNSRCESWTVGGTEVPSNDLQSGDRDVPSSGRAQKRPYQFEDRSEMTLFSDEEDDISSSLSKEIEKARNILSRSRLKRPRSCKPTLPISGELQEK